VKSFLALDTETELIAPGNQAPHLICISWYDGKESGLLHWKDSHDWIKDKLEQASQEKPLVFHNAAFDLAVIGNQFPDLLPLIFDTLDRSAVSDTLKRERLIHIANGTLKENTYSLKDVANRYLGLSLDKDTWRLRYKELKNLPIKLWPQGAVDYAIEDAVTTGKVYEMQEEPAQKLNLFENEPEQTRTAFALYLTSAWGLVTSKEAVDDLELKTRNEIDLLRDFLKEAKVVREDGTRNMKLVEQLMEQSYPNCPRTPTGKPKCDEEACDDSNNEVLLKLSRYRKLQTLITKDILVLRRGNTEPIHTRFESLLETGRTSSSKPNIQNPRREPGVRECYVPRPGYVYASCDYNSAELYTLAQICYTLFGYSKMRDSLLEGKDLHLDFAAQMLGISYESAVERKETVEIKEARQRSKAANFGFPGGMGAEKFSLYAKGTGLVISVDEVKKLKAAWLQNWPEMNDYFKWINTITRSGEPIKQFFSNRYRGNVRYTEACNSFFQGLAADGAKNALYEVCKRCYIDQESPLYGSRPTNFVHDQIILESPEDGAAEAAEELTKVMIQTFNRWTPDVPIKAAPELATCWSKDSKPVYENGKLIPWRKNG